MRLHFGVYVFDECYKLIFNEELKTEEEKTSVSSCVSWKYPLPWLQPRCVSRNEKADGGGGTRGGMGSPGSLRLDGCWREGWKRLLLGVNGLHERKGGDYINVGFLWIAINDTLSRALHVTRTGLGAASPIGFSCKKPNVHPPTLFRESLMNQIHQRDYESGALSLVL